MKYNLIFIFLLFPLIANSAERSEAKYNFTNETEVTIIQTGGNSNIETYNLNTSSKVQILEYIFTLGGHYTLALYESTDDDGDTVKVESARNWDIHLKYEKELNEKVNLYTQIQVEGDKFSGYDQRDNYDLGGKYKFITTKKNKLLSEVGYRYSVEHKVEADENGDSILYANKLRIYSEYQRQHTDDISFKFWLEYLPNFTTPEDYMISFEPSIGVVLSKVFSLKFAYKGIYDNRPSIVNGEYLDYIYTTSIIAKF